MFTTQRIVYGHQWKKMKKKNNNQSATILSETKQKYKQIKGTTAEYCCRNKKIAAECAHSIYCHDDDVVSFLLCGCTVRTDASIRLRCLCKCQAG